MANQVLPSIHRFSSFLRQEREREKRDRNEKILRVLPSMIEKEFSNLSSEKDVYNILPKITGQMYQYGPEVGQIATQIATQMAQSKLNQIQQTRLETQRNEQYKMFGDLLGDREYSVGGNIYKGTELVDFAKERYKDPETIANFLKGVSSKGLQDKYTVIGGDNPIVTKYSFGEDGLKRVVEGRGNRKDRTVDWLNTPEDDKARIPEFDAFIQQELNKEEQFKNRKELRDSGRDAKPLPTTNVITTSGKKIIATKVQGIATFEITDPKTKEKKKIQRPIIEYYDPDGNLLDVEREIGTGLYDDKPDEIKTAELNKIDQDKYRAIRKAGEIASSFSEDFEDYMEDDPVYEELKLTPVDRLTKRLNQELVHDVYRRLLAEKEPLIVALGGHFNPEWIKPKDIDRMVEKEIFTQRQGEFLKAYIDYLKKEKEYQDVFNRYKRQIPGYQGENIWYTPPSK